MEIRNLNLVLTYKCPSQCWHCSYFCGLDGSGLMTAHDVTGYLRALREQPLQSVWIYGGEPFLYWGVLTEVVKIAQRRSIPQIGVLTNGYWAKTRKMALRKLSILKEAGLGAIIISTDGFHSQWVAPEMAARAAHAALEVGLKDVSYSVSFISPRGSANPFNDRSEEIWSQLKESKGVSLREELVTVIGRAAEKLLNFLQLKKVKDADSCQLPGYIGGTLDRPNGLEIDPHGWVMICPGLSLGNAAEQSLADLLVRYAENNNSLWRLMRQRGPAGLLQVAQEKGYVARELYAGRCHFCYELRKFLRPHYPKFLGPDSCYVESS